MMMMRPTILHELGQGKKAKHTKHTYTVDVLMPYSKNKKSVYDCRTNGAKCFTEDDRP